MAIETRAINPREFAVTNNLTLLAVKRLILRGMPCDAEGRVIEPNASWWIKSRPRRARPRRPGGIWRLAAPLAAVR